MSRADLGRNAILGSLTTFGGSLGGFLVRFGATAVLARLLAPEQFGQYALALVDVQFVALIGSFGFSQALLLLEEGQPALLGTVLRLEAAVALVIVLVGLAVFPLVTAGQGKEVGILYLMMIGIVPISRISAVLVSELHHRFAYTHVAILQFVSVSLSSIVAVVVAQTSQSPVALAVKDLGGAALVLLILFAVQWKQDKSRLFAFNRETARRVSRIGFGLFFNQAAETIYTRLDGFLVGTALGHKALGFFQQSRYWAGLPAAFVGPVAGVVGLRTLNAVSKDPLRLSRGFSLVQFVILRILAVFAIGTAVAPDLAVRIALGPGWERTAELLRWFAPWILLSPIAANYKVLLIAVHDFQPTVIATLAASLVLIIGLWPLLEFMGDVGAVLANLAAASTRLWVLARASRRHVELKRRTYYPVLAASTLAISAGLGVRWFIASSSLWLSGTVGVLVSLFVVIASLWFIEGPRIRDELTYVRSKLRSLEDSR